MKELQIFKFDGRVFKRNNMAESEVNGMSETIKVRIDVEPTLQAFEGS